MTDLSPQAQAVLDATKHVYWSWEDMAPNSADVIAAAALRAAGLYLQNAYANEQYVDHADDFLLDLANELERTND